MRTKDGTPWLDTQTSRKVFSSFLALYWSLHYDFSLVSLLYLIFFLFLSCVFLLQGSSHRPPHVERRERAEGVHQGQHTPTLPSVVLGGFRLLRPVGLRPVGSELKLLEFLHCATNCVYCGNKFCVLSSQVSEWAVDHGVPGGTDKDGWQYAADFPTYVNPFYGPWDIISE